MKVEKPNSHQLNRGIKADHQQLQDIRLSDILYPPVIMHLEENKIPLVVFLPKIHNRNLITRKTACSI